MQSFLERLADDLRQSLNQVIGLLELTAEEPLSASQAHQLSQCRVVADRLLRTTVDVSELAAPASPVSRSKPFRVDNVILEVVEVMRLLAERKGLGLHCHLGPGTSHVFNADQDAVQDILRRLLDNSLNFTDLGEITVSVQVSEAVLVIEVADTGTGLPAQVLQAQQGPIDELTGPGLGLKLIRKRLEAAGGTCVFTCGSPLVKNQRGTTVRVSLPQVCQTVQGLAPLLEAETAANLNTPPLNLLVVEDSDESFALLKVFLKDTGHHLSRATNGAVGVAMAQSGEYDLVVMDVFMPVLDGYAATRAIREWETSVGVKRMPILLFSAELLSRQTRIGASVGCSGYLAKPPRKSELLRALRHFSPATAASSGSEVSLAQ